MRNNIRTMFDRYLSYDAVASRMRFRLGVSDEERRSMQAKPCMAD
jgi:hypothetical protein